MGIPHYFAFLTKQYNNIIINEITGVNRLFLDLNCAIHSCCSRVLDNILETGIPYNNEIIENMIIEAVYDYIVFLYSNIKPNKLLYIAIDGVVPYAKMIQQRLRRFKSFKEKSYINELKDKHNKKYIYWDTNSITPGTPFMEKLNTYLHNKFINNKEINYTNTNEELTSKTKTKTKTKTKKEVNAISNIQVILSTSEDQGEGEHKIFNYIKKDSCKDYMDIIYGLDADLIMLSIIANKNKIYLMRESMYFNNEKDKIKIDNSVIKFIYVNIDNLKINLINELNSISSYKIESDIKNIYDYVFICFFLGNDFIPHSLCINIYDNGIYDIINIYINSYMKNGNINLIDLETNEINGNLLLDFMENITILENNNSSIINKQHYTKRIQDRYFKNDYDKKMYEYDNYPIFNRGQDVIKMGEENWRDRYYKYNFNLDRNDLYKINDICKNYMDSIKFTFIYYFEGLCPSWKHYYRFNYAPTFNDIYNYLLCKNRNYINEINIKDETKPFSNIKQLLMVLPPSSSNLLPNDYKKLMTDKDSPLYEFYPLDFDVLKYHKRKMWECIPNIPKYDESYLDELKIY
jgi:5'-3' exonuclease